MATVTSHPTCVPHGRARKTLRRTTTTRDLRVHVSARRSRVAVVPRASSEADDALQFGTAITDYVPSPMDTSALQSQGVVLLTVGVMTAYWWYILVPGARVNLAVNKRTGKLRDYLVELKDDDSRKLERFFYQKWLAKVDPETRYLLRDEPDLFEDAGATSAAATATRDAKPSVSLADTEGVTRDVGEESLEEIVRKARNTPDFWSGDNPVLVALALTIGAGAVAGAFHG